MAERVRKYSKYHPEHPCSECILCGEKITITVITEDAENLCKST